MQCEILLGIASGGKRGFFHQKQVKQTALCNSNET
jgi:hypothetical protein